MSLAWQYTIVGIILTAIIIFMVISLRRRWRDMRQRKKDAGGNSDQMRCAGCAIAQVCRIPRK